MEMPEFVHYSVALSAVFLKGNKDKFYFIVFGVNEQREVSIGDTFRKISDNQ